MKIVNQLRAQWLYPLAAAIVVFTPVVLGVVIWILTQNPFFYPQETFPPRDALLCPGDVLEYDVTLVVTKPAFMRVARMWKPLAGTLDPILVDDRSDLQPHPGTFHTTVRLPVPDLPAGAWDLVVVRYSSPTRPIFYRVHFMVPTDCNEPPIQNFDAWYRGRSSASLGRGAGLLSGCDPSE